MIRFFERVPASAVVHDETGLMARGLCKLITLSDGRRTAVRLKRSVLHRVAYIKNGEAFLSLGGVADQRAATEDLPFAVSCERVCKGATARPAHRTASR
jgi:hypothetical protein